jgi:hypothetical protein
VATWKTGVAVDDVTAVTHLNTCSRAEFCVQSYRRECTDSSVTYTILQGLQFLAAAKKGLYRCCNRALIA